jgi:hypothetical protein
MEFIARAGGLDNFSLTTMRVEQRSPNDVIVYGVRSWEKGGDFLKKDAPGHHKNGWMTVVFASKAGMPPPPEVPIDILIDNGAASGGDEEAALNQIVNMTNGWIWACELAAALTRHGLHPAVLRGMPIPGAPAQLKQYQTLKPTLYPCDTAIPPGKLAEQYLAAIDKQLADLESPQVQQQIARAADIAADYHARGKTLWASSFTHVLDGEVFVNNESPFKAFRGISHNDGKNFEAMNEGDLLFWFGEWTLNMPWTDYLAFIRREKVAYIPCWRPSPEKMEGWDKPEVFHDQKVDDALMVLEQHWPFENAVIDVPFNPGKMAPISGVHLCLQYRMLDEAIAQRIARQTATAPAP